MPKLVVIDDDPSVAVSVRDALPSDWMVLEARDGATGMALVRTHRATLDLVLLDICMPHDGVWTAIQVRSEVPHLPILPITGGAPAVALDTLTGLGCIPPLLKPVPLDELSTAIHQAIGLRPPPLPPDPLFLLPYLRELATKSEHAVMAQRPSVIRVVVLASSPMLRFGLDETVKAAGGAVRTATTHASVLRMGLTELRIAVLVADSGIYSEALALAQEFGLPLLLVARTMSTAYRLADSVQGIVVEPAAPSTMATALAALAAGQRYRDGALDALFAHTPLTRTERTIGTLLLQGLGSEEIVVTLALQPQTLRWHLKNIYGKVGVDSLEQFLEWADAWPHGQARALDA
jgi:DNA-binding NarL/FixJ family response regulator